MSAPSHFATLNACGAPQSRPGASAQRPGGWETAAWATVKLAETESVADRLMLSGAVQQIAVDSGFPSLTRLVLSYAVL